MVRSSLSTYRVAVVCSARSSNSKNDGTTNKLLRAANLARSVSRSEETGRFLSIVEEIKEDHLHGADTAIKSPEIRDRYREAVEAECSSLIQVLDAFQFFAGNNVEAENEIISKGEKLACLFLSLVLEDRGIPAHYIDLSDVIDRQHISADNLETNTYRALTDAFRHDVLASGTKVPVVTGYFGNVAAGLLHRVGRGYEPQPPLSKYNSS